MFYTICYNQDDKITKQYLLNIQQCLYESGGKIPGQEMGKRGQS